MKVLYFECGMGAAGDMLSAALLELIGDKEDFIRRFNALSIPKVSISAQQSVKCGITGTHISIAVDGIEEEPDGGHHDHEHHEHGHHGHDEDAHRHHSHTSLNDITRVINVLPLNEKIKKDAIAVYNIIAGAEAHVHNEPVTQIHFHEVGTMDAVADVVAVCMLIDELKIDKIFASPVNVGSGTVKCAHGILPVPAPATAYILKDIPVYSGTIKSELCTPTGAALLKYFVGKFGDMPVMTVNNTGYGMGKKDFDQANCLRAFIGEMSDDTEDVSELSFNVDDMTAEEIGFACERLFEAGAFEVYTVAIGMKKGRPGTLIRVMCDEEHKENIIKTIYKHTSTIGLRETKTRRYILDRELEEFDTVYGRVRRKLSSGYGTKKKKLEYDDIARIAVEKGISLKEAASLAEASIKIN